MPAPVSQQRTRSSPPRARALLGQHSVAHPSCSLLHERPQKGATRSSIRNDPHHSRVPAGLLGQHERACCVRCHLATPSTNAGGTPQLGNGVRARELALLAGQGRRCPRGACRCQGRSRPPVWWRVVPATRCPSWCAPGFGTTPQRAGTLRPWHPWAPRRGSHRASAHDPGEPSQGARRPGRCGPEQEVLAIVVTPVGCCTSSEDHTVANAAGAPPRGPGRLGSRWRCCVPTLR